MKKIRIGLIGCGRVGTAFSRLVKEKGNLYRRRDEIDIEIVAIGVKHLGKDRDPCVPKELLVEGWQKVAERPDVDLLVELIGGGNDAREAVFDSLRRGRHTVTANKVVLSTEGKSLTELAVKNRCGLCFEAAVGAGTPVIGPIANALNANRFDKLVGIVNGTTNYILSRMTEGGISYEEALKDAVDKGFSETNPDFDVDGKDAAHKLSILSAMAFGVEAPPNEIYTEGIRSITQEDIRLAAAFGYVIKLLAIAHRTPNGLELRVHPALVSGNHPLASVNGEFNAFYLTGDISGEVMMYGRGAGPEPTAGAVLSDVARLAKTDQSTWFSRLWQYDDIEHVPIGDIETGYHLIFPVLDKPGIIGRITSTLGSYNINIESAHAQLPQTRNGTGLVQIACRSAKERDVRAAFRAVSDLPLLSGPARLFRIEVENGRV